MQLLAFVLAIVFLVAFYSSLAGFTDAIAFVRKSDRKLKKLSGRAHSAFSLVPATQQFGYFAPQVCSEFRLLIRLGNSQSAETRDVQFSLSSEAELLLSSLNASAQEELPATVIAGSYASYALNKHRQFDYAFVEVQAEHLPPVSEATTKKPTWVTIRGYFFKK